MQPGLCPEELPRRQAPAVSRFAPGVWHGRSRLATSPVSGAIRRTSPVSPLRVEVALLLVVLRIPHRARRAATSGRSASLTAWWSHAVGRNSRQSRGHDAVSVTAWTLTRFGSSPPCPTCRSTAWPHPANSRRPSESRCRRPPTPPARVSSSPTPPAIRAGGSQSGRPHRGPGDRGCRTRSGR